MITGKPFGGGAERAASAMKNRCTAPLTIDASKPQWNGFSPDVENKRLQTVEAAKLTADQVPNLKLKWAFAMPGSFSAGGTQPTIFGGAVFVASDNNYIYALDAKSGCVYWSYDAKNLMRGSVVIAPVKDVPGVRYGAYIGDYMGRMTAVNAETGASLWTIQVDSHPGAKITSAPVVDPSGTRRIMGGADRRHFPLRMLQVPGQRRCRGREERKESLAVVFVQRAPAPVEQDEFGRQGDVGTCRGRDLEHAND